ncbi:MAG: hypothetical protein LBU30_01670 [Candidatus Methanoplasma sp.]|jgi:hypothetical protein|nr:hypothetical protein [Candidatus Methanoplasma sp.]
MRLDKKGVVGFPMRLAVTSLILAIFIPLAIGMVDDLEKDASISDTRGEAERIADTVKRIYYSGTGSTGTVDVSLVSRSGLVLGGDGSDSYCIAISFDGRTAEKIYLQRPSVKFIGDPLQITGNRTLSIECIDDGDTYGVRVNIVD